MPVEDFEDVVDDIQLDVARHLPADVVVQVRNVHLFVSGVRYFHSTVRNPSWLIHPATYGVTSGPPYVDHSQFEV